VKRNDIVPIGQVNRRMPEAGRIRIGEKVRSSGGKERPSSIDVFRFTSPTRILIEQLAALYGGEVAEWNEPRARTKKQWQVRTTTNEIDVYVAEGGLSEHYELWPGPERRCDGLTCEVPFAHGEDYGIEKVPCICRAEQDRKCDAVTRLTVLLPQVSFYGSWRLDTKSWNAQQELPGVFDLIEALAPGQMIQARLGVEARSSLNPATKKTRNYVVPKLSITQNLIELQSGMANAAQLGAGPRLALPPAGQQALTAGEGDPFVADEPAPDDDVVEAMEVDDELLELEAWLQEDAAEHGLDPARYLTAVYRALQVGSSVDTDQRERMRKLHTQVVHGELIPMGFKADGRIQWGR
jgi:hypothetical protein